LEIHHRKCTASALQRINQMMLYKEIIFDYSKNRNYTLWAKYRVVHVKACAGPHIIFDVLQTIKLEVNIALISKSVGI
jgi:hypothetical protein